MRLRLLLLAMFTGGLTISLHLWAQKERDFSRGCWGIGQPLDHEINGCNDPIMEAKGQFLGLKLAPVGALYFLITTVLSFASIHGNGKVASLSRYIVSLGTSIAAPFALYLIATQIRYSKYCPLCLLVSTLIIGALLVIIKEWRQPIGVLEPTNPQFLMSGIGALYYYLTIILLVGIFIVNLPQSKSMDRINSAGTSGSKLPVTEALRREEYTDRIIDMSRWFRDDRTKIGSGAVAVLLFLDPNCPHCEQSFGAFMQLSHDLNSEATFSLQSYPIWAYSYLQVAALQVAKKENKYFDMWSAQFAIQRRGGLDHSTIIDLFKKLSINSSDYKSSLELVNPSVFNDREACRKSGVSGTPAWFINGRAVGQAHFGREQISILIRKALSQHPQ